MMAAISPFRINSVEQERYNPFKSHNPGFVQISNNSNSGYKGEAAKSFQSPRREISFGN
jgi:hypothetical protein